MANQLTALPRSDHKRIDRPGLGLAGVLELPAPASTRYGASSAETDRSPLLFANLGV